MSCAFCKVSSMCSYGWMPCTTELKSAQKIVVDKTLEPKKLKKLLDPLN